jgi:hypothetical protein
MLPRICPLGDNFNGDTRDLLIDLGLLHNRDRKPYDNGGDDRHNDDENILLKKLRNSPTDAFK